MAIESTWPPASATERSMALEAELKDKPTADVAPRPRASTPAKATATPSKIIPRTTDGRQASAVAVGRAAAKRTTTKKETKVSTTTKAKPAKKAASATKRASDGLDLRALPFVIEWKSSSGDGYEGASFTGDWGSVRFRIKRYLAETKALTAKKASEELTAALAKVRAGRGAQVGPVRITVKKA